MNKIQVYIKAIRAPFFTASIIPVIIGYTFAWSKGFPWVWQNFLLAIFLAVFVHAGINLSNDYFDHISGNDKANNSYS